MNPLVLSLALLTPADSPDDWKAREAVHLRNVRQVTSGLVRAGEGYFAPDGKRIIYQAEEKDTGNPFYQIFVQDLQTGSFRRISPGVGRTTCAYFRPDGKKVIFASSHDNAVLALSQGTVDVAANSWNSEDDSNLTRMLTKGVLKNADGSAMKKEDFRIIFK